MKLEQKNQTSSSVPSILVLQDALQVLGLHDVPQDLKTLREYFIRLIQQHPYDQDKFQHAYEVVMNHFENHDDIMTATRLMARTVNLQRTPLDKTPRYMEAQKFWKDLVQNSQSVGAVLQGLRECCQVDLEAISHYTCLSQPVLTNLEEDKFEAFPALIYYKGFLKAYLDFFGIQDSDFLKKAEKLFNERASKKAF